ncbi:M20/M25/M40 family metallo-hydrolase [Fulvimarina endophytica]|uniref:M20/M25/M40 family metallo-hydrolase n=1 Tax=Fulvimarina endophytica TaxID=2293836 RepID=A0A371X4P1_9HYPH|nr:M20/M25/M40 family metallo-hydrolase [Fulvimarina endophytica]RFC64159.1 M20/M25/M40 family metallo-hydrolase [Fulvimarina endophytica]
MFDVKTVPLDADVMLARLRPWIELESPTYDKPAVDAMTAMAAADMEKMGFSVEVIPGPEGLGDCARASFPHPKAGEPGILIIGHLDTVHPIGTLEKLPFRREGDKCWGPGICDMKGGNYAAISAVKALAEMGHETKLPVHVLLTSDEEIGTPGTRALIEAEAARHKYVLVPEPAWGRNTLVTGRYAIARYHLTANGRPSHAGAALSRGQSAVKMMARELLAIEEMTGEDCTFSVSVVHGGQWVNCVPTVCRAECLSMAKRQEDLDRGTERILAFNRQNDDGTGFVVERSVVRPVWEASAGTMDLFERAKRIGLDLGFELSHASEGGGSDGNFTGAMGLPTLDGLGVVGANVHTLDEHIEVSSLVSRGRLIAGLLADLD